MWTVLRLWLVHFEVHVRTWQSHLTVINCINSEPKASWYMAKRRTWNSAKYLMRMIVPVWMTLAGLCALNLYIIHAGIEHEMMIHETWSSIHFGLLLGCSILCFYKMPDFNDEHGIMTDIKLTIAASVLFAIAWFAVTYIGITMILTVCNWPPCAGNDCFNLLCVAAFFHVSVKDKKMKLRNSVELNLSGADIDNRERLATKSRPMMYTTLKEFLSDSELQKEYELAA